MRHYCRDQERRIHKRTAVLFIAAVTILSLCAVSARAEDLPVSIAIDKKTLPLGDTAVFTINLKQGEITPPEIPDTEDLDITYLGAKKESFSGFHVVIINGRMQSTKTSGGTHYAYSVVPKRVGVLTFPTVDINVNGKILRTNPFSIEVTEQADLSKDVFVVQQLDKNEIYLGESVRYRLKWYFNKDIEGYECNLPWMSSLKNFMIRDPEVDQNKPYQRFIINGSDEVLAEKTTETYNGAEYAVVSFEKVLVPLAPGEFDLDPALVRCDVVKAYQQQGPRSFFDNFIQSDFDSFFGMGRQAVTEPFSAASQPLHLSVKEVPQEDRPAGFSSAIGKYEFNVGLSSKQVKVGEPITITMAITGEGNLEQVDMPALPEMADFKGYDPESKVVKKTVNGHELVQKIFEKVVIPKNAGTFTIPELRFIYFDAQERQYKTLTQGPFEIKVDKADGFDEGGVRLVAIDEKPGDNAKEIEIVQHDIRFIKTSLGEVFYNARPWHKNMFLVIAVICLPIIVTAGLSQYNRRRIRYMTDHTFAKEMKAFKKAQARLKSLTADSASSEKDFYFEAVKVLNEYLSAKLRLPIGTITPDIARDLVAKGVGAVTAEKIREFYEVTDRIKFASGLSVRNDEKGKKELIDRLREIIGMLEKEL
jgi:hypothetical protein